jgi:hypothetical protein
MALPRFFIGLIALLALTAQSAAGFYSTLEKDFDYVNHDIGNQPAASASQCPSMCDTFTGCNAFSWSNNGGGTCWFKSQRGLVVYKPGVTSAYKSPVSVPFCPISLNVDYVGNDLARVFGANPFDCCNKCKEYPGCRAFSFTLYLGGSCWLKSSKGATFPNLSVRSSEVYPPPPVVAPPRCPTVQDGVDFFDHDIGNAPSPTAAGCCSICSVWSGCRAFSWSNHNGGTCWLKSMVGNVVSNANVKSAVL